jgi:hypothetical protein
MSRRRIVLLALLVIVFVLLWLPRLLSRPLPSGVPGSEADALARRMMAAGNDDAWKATGAVAFSFRGKNHHLWDRRRGYLRVAFGDRMVWLDLASRRGLAEKGGEPLGGAALQEALDKAWALFCNDTFWLNPVAKLFDDGVQRYKVAPPEDHAGSESLLITYTTGGTTPGDSYLWIVGPDGLPTHWRMWTSILPVKGLEASWEGWIDLPTGAKVATRHAIGPLTLELGDLRAAADLSGLEPGGDPFEALAALLATPAAQG